MEELILIFLGAALVNNFVLSRFLGMSPFLGVTKEVNGSIRLGVAVTVVMLVSTAIIWPLYHLVLIPMNLGYMQYVSFILVIAVLVQFLDATVKRYRPALYEAFGLYVALITINCAVLGVALMMTAGDFTFGKSIVFAFGAGSGYTLAMAMMAAIREELEFADIPETFQGPALALITAGLMALSFMGFAGLGS